MKIGIIGFGRFGELITKFLAKDFDVMVYSRSDRSEPIVKAGAIQSDIESVCRCDMIIPCIPISVFEDTIKKIARHIKKGCTVIDVCSVKEFPADVMKKYLPDSVGILATHPMFGPDSASDSVEGKKIVLCRVRMDSDRFNKIKGYLKDKGLDVIEASAQEHDMQIAKTQLLTHFIGRSLIEMGAEQYAIDTEGYTRLMHILGVVKNDTWQLFYDMNRYNRYSEQARKDFIESINKVDEKVKK